jgi:hypothetical protein
MSPPSQTSTHGTPPVLPPWKQALPAQQPVEQVLGPHMLAEPPPAPPPPPEPPEPPPPPEPESSEPMRAVHAANSRNPQLRTKDICFT